MEISVSGLRTSTSDWEAVRNLPREQLPSLTPEQRQVAQKLRIPEEDYARSVLGGQRTTESLLGKTERLARFLQDTLRVKAPEASLERVALNTWEEKFDVEIEINRTSLALRIEENLINDFMEGGSAAAEESLRQMMDVALRTGLPR